MTFPTSPASSHCTSPSFVWMTTTRSWHRSPRFVSRMECSHAGRNGWAARRSIRGVSGVLVRVLLAEGTRRGGCEEHRPPSSTVAVMKTMSRWYPAQSRPLSMHFLHCGRWLSHCKCQQSPQSGHRVPTYLDPAGPTRLAPLVFSRNTDHVESGKGRRKGEYTSQTRVIGQTTRSRRGRR